MSAQILVTCDGCGVHGAAGKTHREARRRNKQRGWLSPKRGLDLCDKCKPPPKAANDPTRGYV